MLNRCYFCPLQKLRSFQLEVEVDQKHHPKIIGRRGAVITKIRDNHDVQIKFPDKGSERQDIIAISGYEQNANAAKEEILKIVGDLVRSTLVYFVNMVVGGMNSNVKIKFWRKQALNKHGLKRSLICSSIKV